MKLNKIALSTMLALGSLGVAQAQNPSVVVTLENMSPYNGSFLTPVWVGFHNGQFDTYDGGTLASSLPINGSDAMERLAEDGNVGPLSDDFSTLVPNGVQGTIRSNGTIPPLAPGQISSRLFEVDPANNKYFSYASMVIPSNDAFIANGSAFAHQVFNEAGDFVGRSFYVRGDAPNDAGTEANDEFPANTAFFGQAAPNTGVTTNDLITAHPGLLDPALRGILADPMFGDADFLQQDYNLLRVKLTYIDKAAPALFTSNLSTTFEAPAPVVDGSPTGRAFFILDEEGDSLVYFAFANGLSGDLTAAHVHLSPLTQSGPVVLPLQTIFGRFVFGKIDASAVVGPLGGTDRPLDSLIAEIVSGATYVNMHTAANPAGEIRGQVHPSNLR